MTHVGNEIYLADVVTGSVAVLAPENNSWRVRESGPVKLWHQVESLLDAYDAAGQPGPQEFTLRVSSSTQQLTHPHLPTLRLPNFAASTS